MSPRPEIADPDGASGGRRGGGAPGGAPPLCSRTQPRASPTPLPQDGRLGAEAAELALGDEPPAVIAVGGIGREGIGREPARMAIGEAHVAPTQMAGVLPPIGGVVLELR